MKSNIVAIETSCDETGVAVLRGDGDKIRVLAEQVASQVDIHQKTGGVVPEVAAREHVTVIQPMIKQVITASGVKPDDIDAIAVTVGPGLMPALSIGVTAAQTLAYSWQKPVVPVHHVEGHIYAALLSEVEKAQNWRGTNLGLKRQPAEEAGSTYRVPDASVLPVLALVVSGGHTMLVEMKSHLRYKTLGSTRDDAAGEAFDKVARLLGLGYPGGPAISAAARGGRPSAWQFTRPMLRAGNLDFSFSGLKTEVLYTLRDLGKKKEGRRRRSDDFSQLSSERKNDIAASFQQAVVDTLVAKTKQAMERSWPQTLLLAGGVAANRKLREEMQALADDSNLSLRVPNVSLCQDNGVMIGMVGVLAYRAGRVKTWREIDARARINLEECRGDRFADGL